jgi:serine/threonine protein kinase
MRKEHVWWLMHPSSKTVIAGRMDPRFNSVRELSLRECVDIFGLHLPLEGSAYIKNEALPFAPPKYLEFLKKRKTLFSEIYSMANLSGHENIIHLYEVLELIQDSKSTIFLVCELAAGGELFDFIDSNEEREETVIKSFFHQILSG